MFFFFWVLTNSFHIHDKWIIHLNQDTTETKHLNLELEKISYCRIVNQAQSIKHIYLFFYFYSTICVGFGRPIFYCLNFHPSQKTMFNIRLVCNTIFEIRHFLSNFSAHFTVNFCSLAEFTISILNFLYILFLIWFFISFQRPLFWHKWSSCQPFE